MTEREKMLSGTLYSPADPELSALRMRVRQLCIDYSRTDECEQEKRANILHAIFASHGSNTYMEPGIRFDYGCNTTVGNNFFANFNCTILDCARVEIGDDVFFGPGVSLLTPLHPLLASERNVRSSPDSGLYNLEYARPIKIGSNVWLGAGVTVNPGVEIGNNTVIGSGSVVTSDIPGNVIAAGVPCRIIRSITPDDRLFPEEA